MPTPEEALVLSAIGYLACVLALAVLVWPWVRAAQRTRQQDWIGENGSEAQR